jgi:hypothetical protein
MRQTHIHIEVVSVEEAKKILKRERLLAKRNGHRKLVGVKESGKLSGRPRTRFTRTGVSTS